MKRIMIGVLLSLLFIGIGLSETTKTCIDSDTLKITTNKTLTINSDVKEIEEVEEINCLEGCINGECKPTSVNITIPLYIMFSCFGILIMLISFLKSDIIIFKWLSVIIFLMLGASSFNINKDFCEYTGSGWSCYIQQYKMVNLAYLWYGLALVMFIYAFYSSVVQPAKEIRDRPDGLRA
jgi:hypothetical protein